MNAARTIKIVSEKQDHDLDKDPEFLRAWQLIDNAEKLCFLGFGYHERNVERLKIDNGKQKPKIYGTAKGVGESEKKRIRDVLRGIELGNFDCLEMPEQFGVLI